MRRGRERVRADRVGGQIILVSLHLHIYVAKQFRMVVLSHEMYMRKSMSHTALITFIRAFRHTSRSGGKSYPSARERRNSSSSYIRY